MALGICACSHPNARPAWRRMLSNKNHRQRKRRFAENGQAGPCLTDAARSAALDAPFAKLPLRRDPNATAAVIAAQIARGHNKPPVHQGTSAPDTQNLGSARQTVKTPVAAGAPGCSVCGSARSACERDRHRHNAHELTGVIQPTMAPPGSLRMTMRPTPGTSKGSLHTVAPAVVTFFMRASTSSTAT